MAAMWKKQACSLARPSGTGVQASGRTAAIR